MTKKIPWLVILTGVVTGLAALVLTKAGNPGNMGFCIACFLRDISGGVGLHTAAKVQYIRPEIIGLVLGACIMALVRGEFTGRAGSTPALRFVIGAFVMVGALAFLGCPLRMVLRLGGGDLTAIAGLLGFIVGILVGVLFLKKGFSLGRAYKVKKSEGFVLPAIMIFLLVLLLIKPAFLYFSETGPGSMHAPFLISLGVAFVIGMAAQKSRFCTVGALRDLFLFGSTHLFLGLFAMLAAAFVANLLTGGFHFGMENQPVAHTMSLWNFLGMVTAGLAFALAGGCPGRQLFMAGEGDGDAGLFALGMITGAALAHNLGTASSGTGIGQHGIAATLIGLAICLVIGFAHTRKV